MALSIVVLEELKGVVVIVGRVSPKARQTKLRRQSVRHWLRSAWHHDRIE
jgi:hypothetical protein